MNKAELIEALSGRLGDRKSATAALDAVLAEIQNTVTKGDKVSITGFGVFEKRVRAARTARNPRTGESVKVKKTSVPAFRPGASFKELVAAGKLPKVAAAAKAAPAKTTRPPRPRRPRPPPRRPRSRRRLRPRPPAKKAPAKTAPAQRTATRTHHRQEGARPRPVSSSPQAPRGVRSNELGAPLLVGAAHKLASAACWRCSKARVGSPVRLSGVTPFTVNVPEADLDELRSRLARRAVARAGDRVGLEPGRAARLATRAV